VLVDNNEFSYSSTPRTRVAEWPIGVAADEGGRRHLRLEGEEYRFHLRAANGEIIASSEGYKSKAGAQKRIA
jgi:Domain of unknown function (DUF1508)